jgi:large subunit ribosomal protein L4
MKLPVLSVEGKELRSLEVDESVFGIKPNEAVLHQAFVTQRNHQRAGTASTKTRGMVQGSTRKTRMQKYTGRARHGGIRAPIFVGGGTVFGPQPRDFGGSINKKMRRLAIRSALSGKLADGQLVVVDELKFETPKTKEVVRILQNVGIERSALIVTGQPDRSVLASARNLGKMKVLPAAYLNVVDMLNHRHLLMTEEAVKIAEGLWGEKRTDGKGRAGGAAPVEAPPRRKPAKEKAQAGAVAEAAPSEAPKAPARRRAKAAEAEAPPTEAPAEGAKPRSRSRATKAAADQTAKPETPKRPPRQAKPAEKPSDAGSREAKTRTRARKSKTEE